MKIDKNFIKSYFKYWLDYNKPTKNDYSMFIEMLQGKVYAAKRYKKKIYCYDDLYNWKDIEKMLEIADDNMKYLLEK